MEAVDEIVDKVMSRQKFSSDSVAARTRSALMKTLETVARIRDNDDEDFTENSPEEIRYDDSDGVPVIMPESLLGMQQRRKAELRAAAKSMFSPDEFVLDNQSDTIVADDINRKMKWGYTLLHFAAVEGNEVEIDRLLSLGADKTITDNSGKMPYQKAERKGFVDLAKKLMP